MLKDLDAVEFDKIYTKLRNIEKESKANADWSKAEEERPRPEGSLFPYSDPSRK